MNFMCMKIFSTYLDVLPAEILVQILILLPRKFIKHVYEVLLPQTINIMPSLSNILEKRSQCFPRSFTIKNLVYNVAIAHKVPISMISDELLHWDDNAHNKNKYINRLLLYLHWSDVDLIKGDIVYFENDDIYKLLIFDGKNLIPLLMIDGQMNYIHTLQFSYEINILPEKFDVITNDVPIFYWKNMITSNCDNFHHSNYRLNLNIDDPNLGMLWRTKSPYILKLVWLNHNVDDIKTQMISNAKFSDDGILDNTTFTYFSQNIGLRSYNIKYGSNVIYSIEDYTNLLKTPKLVYSMSNFENIDVSSTLFYDEYLCYKVRSKNLSHIFEKSLHLNLEVKLNKKSATGYYK